MRHITHQLKIKWIFMISFHLMCFLYVFLFHCCFFLLLFVVTQKWGSSATTITTQLAHIWNPQGDNWNYEEFVKLFTSLEVALKRPTASQLQLQYAVQWGGKIDYGFSSTKEIISEKYSEMPNYRKLFLVNQSRLRSSSIASLKVNVFRTIYYYNYYYYHNLIISSMEQTSSSLFKIFHFFTKYKQNQVLNASMNCINF